MVTRPREFVDLEPLDQQEPSQPAAPPAVDPPEGIPEWIARRVTRPPGDFLFVLVAFGWLALLAHAGLHWLLALPLALVLMLLTLELIQMWAAWCFFRRKLGSHRAVWRMVKREVRDLIGPAQ
jgi:hypothetical protein